MFVLGEAGVGTPTRVGIVIRDDAQCVEILSQAGKLVEFKRLAEQSSDQWFCTRFNHQGYECIATLDVGHPKVEDNGFTIIAVPAAKASTVSNLIASLAFGTMVGGMAVNRKAWNCVSFQTA